MLRPRSALDRPVALLLSALASPERALPLSLDDWDDVVRVARGARLLGVLRARLERARRLDSIPPPVRAHLDSAWNVAAYRRQMVLREMHGVAKALEPLRIPMILLKGGAYIAQRLACADGRLPEDLDLMVPRERLDEAERALAAAGWALEKTDPYDEHYYRAWSHELPPMRAPGHAVELDLHHTILPPTGRVRPDARALVESAVAVSGSRFLALAPADQVLHACAHLFQDSDLAERLRDLVDIDALVREHAADPDFWTTLLARARLHGLGRSLSHAFRYCTAWLETPFPKEIAAEVARSAPGPVRHAAMDRLVERALLPYSPDEEPTFDVRFARRLLLARSVWLRMPPWLLAYHALAKLVRWRPFGPRAAADG
jgi:hypothetical protein